MELNEIVSLIVNNATAVAVLAYFVIRDWKFTERLDTTLATLQKSVENVEEALDHLNKDRE